MLIKPNQSQARRRNYLFSFHLITALLLTVSADAFSGSEKDWMQKNGNVCPEGYIATTDSTGKAFCLHQDLGTDSLYDSGRINHCSVREERIYGFSLCSRRPLLVDSVAGRVNIGPLPHPYCPQNFVTAIDEGNCYADKLGLEADSGHLSLVDMAEYCLDEHGEACTGAPDPLIGDMARHMNECVVGFLKPIAYPLCLDNSVVLGLRDFPEDDHLSQPHCGDSLQRSASGYCMPIFQVKPCAEGSACSQALASPAHTLPTGQTFILITVEPVSMQSVDCPPGAPATITSVPVPTSSNTVPTPPSTNGSTPNSFQNVLSIDCSPMGRIIFN